jgi:uncharacterized repeat protein (TIGR03803 family)
MKLHRSAAPKFEILEEKVLLSSGIGKPAAATAIIASKTPKPFSFNGKLPLKLTATDSGVAPGFREKNSFAPMGQKVKVSGTLASLGSTLSDGLPNLSGSTFVLSNASGKLLVTLSSSTTDVYAFTISGGTKRFVRADGTTGTALLGVAPKKGFALTFKTTGHGSQSSNPPISGTLVALASFDGNSIGTTGGNPAAGMTLDSQGNLYGTTASGGAFGYGTVYEIAKGSSTLVTIASFDVANGETPSAGVTIDAQGNLYGTTQFGGPGGLYDGLGTVWEIAKGTNTITTLASFSVATGYQPLSGVTLDAQGDLFGTAYKGGVDGLGTVWELAKGSNTISTIASFDGANGEYPNYGVTPDAQGNLYGTPVTTTGAIWEIVNGSNTITKLPGTEPFATDSQGEIYEAGFSGASHQAYVLEYSRLASGNYIYSKQFVFSGTYDDAVPHGLMLDAQGNLYGIIGDTLWEIANGSSTISTLASFDGTNGSNPMGGLTLDADGNLYGTALDGGADGFGTVWEFVVGAVPSVRAAS